VQRQVTDLGAVAMHAQMHDAAAAGRPLLTHTARRGAGRGYSRVVRIARLRSPWSVVVSGASSSERAWWSPIAGVLPSWLSTLGRLTPLDRIAGHRICFAQVFEHTRQRRQFASDRRARQRPGLQVVTPGEPLRSSASPAALQSMPMVTCMWLTGSITRSAK
jgi:hypothetical protein